MSFRAEEPMTESVKAKGIGAAFKKSARSYYSELGKAKYRGKDLW